MVFDATLVAVRPRNNYTVKKVLAYETLSETEWGNPVASDMFIPTYFEDVDELYFEKKMKALSFSILKWLLFQPHVLWKQLMRCQSTEVQQSAKCELKHLW